MNVYLFLGSLLVLASAVTCDRRFDLIIIGAGSGNMIPDPTLFPNWSIAIIERDKFGGTCLNRGCLPTKMMVHTANVAKTATDGKRFGVDSSVSATRWTDIQKRILEQRVDKYAESGYLHRRNQKNITVYRSQARFIGFKRIDTGSKEVITADRIVLAVGGRPSIPRELKMAKNVRYYTSDNIMRVKNFPKKLIILGSGFVAAEFAHIFGSLGSNVTIVVRSNKFLSNEDAEVSKRFTDLAVKKWDVRMMKNATRAEMVNGKVRLHIEPVKGSTGKTEFVEGDELLIATGRVPNSDTLNLTATRVQVNTDGRIKVDKFQKTNIEGILACGDVSSRYQQKHVANHECRLIQHNLAFPKKTPKSADHRFVPAAVFTQPQIASVGLTEEAAKKMNVDYVKSYFNYSSTGYGWAMEDTTGFVKVLADRKSKQLIGGHIIGPEASVLIQPIIQAMHSGLDAKTMAYNQYWIHPAMPEVVENALRNLPFGE